MPSYPSSRLILGIVMLATMLGQSTAAVAEESSKLGLQMSHGLRHVPPVVPRAIGSSLPAPTPASLPEIGLAQTPRLAIAKETMPLTPRQQTENRYREASRLIAEGKHAEAITTLETILRDDAGHYAARQTLVGILLEQKQPALLKQAMQHLQEGLARDVTQVGWAMLLARLQVEEGDIPAAFATLQRTLPHAEERADYQAFLAAILQRLGKHREAVDRYALALRQLPETSHRGAWWIGMGLSLEAENRSTEARAAFSRAQASTGLSKELAAFIAQKLSGLE